MESNVNISQPHFEWEPGSYGIEDILKTHDLPVTIQCDLTECRVRLQMFNFDLTQPLLLYKKQQHVVKTAADSVLFDKATKKFKQVGDSILIPKDYKGWFAVLGDPDDNNEDKPVPHYRQVEQLAVSRCQQFLIGGSENIEALQIRHDKEVSYLPKQLSPGDVLKKGNLYTTSTKIKSKRLGSKTNLKQHKFVMCTDEQDRECLLPMEQRGMFYMISGYSSSATLPILQMRIIAEKIKYPCLVKLVYGRVLQTPCSFTGVLLLKKRYTESSVIASTVVNLNNILVDLPLHLPLKFRVAVRTRSLLSSSTYNAAVALCKATADTYSRSLKILHHIPEGRDYNESRSKKEQELSVRPKETKPILSDATTIDECSTTNETDTSVYEEVWCQKLHSPRAAPTDRTSMMNMCVPLGQPVGTLQPPKTGFTKENTATNKQNQNQGAESLYQNINPIMSHILNTDDSSNYQNIPTMSPNNTFIFYEGYSVDRQATKGSILKQEKPIPEETSVYENIVSLKRLSVSELSPEKGEGRDVKAKVVGFNIRSRRTTPCEDESTVNTVADIQMRPNSSFVDDLPLGADSSFFKTRPLSLGADSGVGIEHTLQEDVYLNRLSVSELCEHLKHIGVRKKTIAKMKEECVDGRLLQKLDEDELRESFPEITNIDIKKISLFVQGWTLNS